MNWQFRGKRVDNKEWVYGYYLVDEQHDKPRHCIWMRESVGDFITNDMIEVDPSTVGIGIEIDGKWYFEGDIGWDGHEYCKICFDNGCFLIYYPSLVKSSFHPSPYGHLYCDANKIKIVSTIWDNPELLGGQNEQI